MASSVVNMARTSRTPVIVVLGATGTGKSKLALEIARKFHGEIISADAMQVYRGLDIVTNKVTNEEQAMAPHHLLNFLDPLSRYSVLDFRNAALPLMERLLGDCTMPVIVGGTNYYIESLLWNVLVEAAPDKEIAEHKLIYERDKEYFDYRCPSSDESAFKKNKVDGVTCENLPKKNKIDNASMDDGLENNNVLIPNEDSENDESEQTEPSEIKENVEEKNKKLAWQDCDVPTEDLYQRLLEVDPTSALQYHPNNRRKIIRSLQVWEQTGRQHSEVLKEQQKQIGGSNFDGGLRFKHAAILWITCQQESLDVRLDDRVDDMIERGLLQELTDFHSAYNAARLREGQEADYTKGIFQSIGFKEFHQYLILSEEERNTEKGRRLYMTGIEALKQVTRRYSRKQVRWIRNRFILPSKRQVPPVYTVDGTDLNHWNEKVKEPAISIVQSLLNGDQPGYETAKFSRNAEFSGVDTNDKTRYECDVCGRVVIGQLQWLSHLKGGKHRKMLKRKHQTNTGS